MSRDIYQEVTDRILAQLEAGVCAWVKPWKASAVNGGMPYNAVSGKPYRGINVLMLYAPQYQRFNDWVHQHTRWKTFYHSCGSVYHLIEPMIRIGVDILNPLQCSAANMEPERLKREFGSRLCLWGGGVDTQKTLPFGTPDEVRAEVAERVRIFAAGGGFVFNAVHNIQRNSPPENLVAMLEAVNA